MRSWVKMALAAAAALTLAAQPAAAQVPDPYARELAQRLSRAETVLVENGYARAAGPFAAGLGEREGRRFSLMMRAGQDYRVVGVCESRCRDFNLRLFDASGRLIGQDVLEDNVPVVHVRPRTTGRHTVEVEMVRCVSEPCWFAFNVYSR
ncbi:MAG TPA: hypothetical protein VEA80_18070 [Vitreimonas sp.]|uniref:hypothetical protein n=1 Tax=Vitreimonas sp. TaxID=3069702 RepID=UPI002D2E0DBC|nr:hypothetical protein [Vitreimonas sp.]HYD89391.1 hypothetical protein [Vitreimonas sp.]